MIDKSNIVDDRTKELMMNELEVLQRLSHPHMTQVYRLLEDDEKFYIVNEIIRDGDLFDLFHEYNNHGFKEDEVIKMAVQVLGVLNYMH